MLLPIPGHPLKAKFHGPYTVEQQLGPVDYVISTPDRRKTKRVCHVNLLKRYHQRDSRFVTCVISEPAGVQHEAVPDQTKAEPAATDLIPELPPEEQIELKAILMEFSDVFSDKLGRTNLAVHHIQLLPRTHKFAVPHTDCIRINVKYSEKSSTIYFNWTSSQRATVHGHLRL